MNTHHHLKYIVVLILLTFISYQLPQVHEALAQSSNSKVTPFCHTFTEQLYYNQTLAYTNTDNDAYQNNLYSRDFSDIRTKISTETKALYRILSERAGFQLDSSEKNGKFGLSMAVSVATFQKNNGLMVNGVLDTPTSFKLNALYGCIEKIGIVVESQASGITRIERGNTLKVNLKISGLYMNDTLRVALVPANATTEVASTTGIAANGAVTVSLRIPAAVSTGDYKIRATIVTNNISALSKGVVSIFSSDSITINRPSGDSPIVVTPGRSTTIGWTISGNVGPVSISYIKNGATTTLVSSVKSISGSNSYVWNTPVGLLPGTGYKFQVKSVELKNISDTAVFSVVTSKTVGTVSTDVSSAGVRPGQPVVVSWSSGNVGVSTVRVELFKDQTSLSAKSLLITASEKERTFVIPKNVQLGNNFFFKVTDISNMGVFSTSTSFAVVAPSLTIMNITSGSQAQTTTVSPGDKLTITWKTDGTVPKISLYYVDTNGVNNVIDAVEVNRVKDTLTSYVWTIPKSFATVGTFHIYITQYQNAAVNDTSDTTFSVVVPAVTLSNPTAGQSFMPGDTIPVAWNYSDSMTVSLFKGDALIVNKSLQTKGTSYNLTVPTDVLLGTDYTVKVVSNTNAAIATTSHSFSITSNKSIASVVLRNKATNQTASVYKPGDTVNATFVARNIVDIVFELVKDGRIYPGTTKQIISANRGETGADIKIGTGYPTGNYAMHLYDPVTSGVTISVPFTVVH